MIINHNLQAMNANRQMGINQGTNAASMEKLSSGLRINRAGDDAAGLTISEKMRSQINGLNQASRNAQDGISMIQTAEGALDETHSILQRMRELSVQASTDTNDDQDRAAIQDELDALTEEIDRIASDTEFNGKNILDADEKITLQVGANANQQIDVNMKEMDADKLLGGSSAVGGAGYKEVNMSTELLHSGELLTEEQVDDIKDVLRDLGYGIKTANSFFTKDASGFKLTANGGKSFADMLSVVGRVFTVPDAEVATDGVDLEITRALVATGNIYGEEDREALEALMKQLGATDTQINGFFEDASSGAMKKEGGKFLQDAIASGKIEIGQVIEGIGKKVATAGKDIQVTTAMIKSGQTLTKEEQQDLLAVLKELGVTVGGNVPSSHEVFSNGVLKSAVAGMIDTQVGASILKTHKEVGRVIPGGGTANLDVSDMDGANKAIETIDAAIKKVSEFRSELGAVQNRLEHTIKNLDNAAENTQAAESRIRDVDMAEEMMEFTKTNVLSQASQSMLAQANQKPNQVLQLLG